MVAQWAALLPHSKMVPGLSPEDVFPMSASKNPEKKCNMVSTKNIKHHNK